MKVLILCYDFPPLVSVGAQRPYGWFKYLRNHQIATTIVTRHWNRNISKPNDFVQPSMNWYITEPDIDSNAIVRVPFKPNSRDKFLLKFGLYRFVFFRKILSLLYSVFEHLFFVLDNRASIYKEAKRQIEKNKPDYIIATGEPFILFKYAHTLSLRYNIPWVADYRDGWTNNQGDYKLDFPRKMLNAFFHVVEKKYLSNVSFITTASPSYAVTLKKNYPTKEVAVIYNGFDDQHFHDIDTIQPDSDKFVITYAGIIYKHQKLEMFLDGLQQFVVSEKINPLQFEVQFYGLDAQPQNIARLLNYRKELSSYIKILPKIPYAEIIKKLRLSHVLLLLSGSGANWLNAKVFDYFAVKRKTLLVENDRGILKKLLDETNGGFAANSAEEVADFLKKEYTKYQMKGSFDIELNNNYLLYSRRNQAEVFANLLKQKLQPNGL